MDKSNGTLLVVDDVASHRKTINGHLSSAGYSVMEAESGKEALEKVSDRPSLLLLGFPVPDMDGIELCRELKADESTRDIPVIFISGVKDLRIRTRGFDAGGVDWVNRPVDPCELLARVKTHLTIQTQQRRIAGYRKKLASMSRERTRLLIHSDRLATLGAFSASVAHEINNPVSYIMGNVELIKYTWQDALPILERHFDEDESGRLEKALPRLDKKLTLILEGADRISRLVREFRAHYRQAEKVKKECRLLHIVNDASDLLVHRFKRGITLAVDVAEELTIYGDPQKLSQVFVNLFNHAMDTMGSEKGAITIAATRCNGHINIHVKDDGPGVDREKAHRIFDPDFTTEERDGETGWGLYIVRSIIEDHNGNICLGECRGAGVPFDIVLPASAN